MKKMMDGNTACANIAYKCSEIAYIYPITPSSPMAEHCDDLQSLNTKNIFDSTLKMIEMQSEGGVSGALHGSCLAGALTTTFTSSQGLLLMLPNMYKIAGELLPTVIHVASRSIATHALNIFCDHSDVMSARQTGFAMLCSNNAQECQDFALASHITTLKSRIPFLHFFDGFRTSHEISKVEEISDNQIKQLMPYSKIKEFKDRAINPTNPTQHGTTQNSDIYFQTREASNIYYNKLPKLLKQTFSEIKKVTGRDYKLFEYVGNKNAENIIIALGSGSEVVEDYIKKTKTNNLALIKVRLFRPFSIKDFTKLLHENVKNIIVLDRTKENGSIGEPLYLDVVNCINEQSKKINVFGGIYGLGGKEFDINMVNSIYNALISNKLKNHFTIGINDDVTKKSLPIKKIKKIQDNSYACIFYGLGSDGTISANKNSIKIIGDNTNLNAQAFFVYDSKKSGSLTTSHLRFSRNKIISHYLIDSADFIAVHNKKFLQNINIFKNLKKNGTVLINCNENDLNLIPNDIKYQLFLKSANIYYIDANSIANQVGLSNKINIIMQTAFFKLTNFIKFEEIKNLIEESIVKTYSKYGKDIIDKNIKVIDITTNSLAKFNIPENWKENLINQNLNVINDSYYNNFIKPILNNKGNELSVSAMSADGSTPTNTSFYEKRNIANYLPMWITENCIQCGQCSMVCPHGAIRPILIKDEDLVNYPKNFKFTNAIGVKNAKFVLQFSPKDCTGCKNCAITCPTLKKAIEMRKATEIIDDMNTNYEFSQSLPKLNNPFNDSTVKGCQFNLPYFEFSGACSGCGETPYIRLLTQLFGNRMLIANATGCSSIYGGSCPTCPYTKDSMGCGPAWANSLFEDNAEFGLGMKLANDKQRNSFEKELTEKLKLFKNSKLKQLLLQWLENKENAKQTIEIFSQLQLLINSQIDEDRSLLDFVKQNLKHITKKSTWIVGGDGWAYDIGFGGLDHVLSTGENINVLVLDTEVYSNTGGQTSKSTPIGASAKFNKLGKTTNKKNLAQIFMSYKNIYVAQVAMGADKNQLIKALKEAESYNGPSLIIAYSTCINHGIKEGYSMTQMKEAVESGYFHLFRYNPLLEKPFTLDSKQPTKDFISHALTEKRFSSIHENNKNILIKAKENSIQLYEYYKKLNDEQ